MKAILIDLVEGSATRFGQALEEGYTKVRPGSVRSERCLASSFISGMGLLLLSNNRHHFGVRLCRD